MAVITIDKVRIGRRGDNVALEVPIGGGKRTLVFDPVDTIQIANLMATAAIDMVPRRASAALVADEIALKPYGADGFAHLAVLTAEHGPFVIHLDAGKLLALSEAARGALECAEAGGHA